MNKIINGKRYDTARAKRIAAQAAEEGGSSVLYRKRTGEYFLCCCDQGERLIPLTYEESKTWAERHMTADEYEAEFGAVDETAGTAVLSIMIPAALNARIEREVQATGKTKKQIICEKLSR